MTLKDKRRELELSFLDCFPEHQHIVYAILEGIEQQDAQAIKEFYNDFVLASHCTKDLNLFKKKWKEHFGDFEEKQK